jgi:anthranilate synthase component 2
MGLRFKNLETVVHGQATPISIISEDTLFHNCPNNFLVGRYHSWVINNQHLSNELEITAKDLDGNIMALKHKKDDVKGVQFHPESILSEYGETIINNWLKS